MPVTVEDAFAARMAVQAAVPEALTKENLRPPYQIRHRPNRPHHQRTPSSHCGKGGGPERSKPRPSNLMCLRSRRTQTTMTIRRLRHIFRWIAPVGRL
jgi:hypothetical protein